MAGCGPSAWADPAIRPGSDFVLGLSLKCPGFGFRRKEGSLWVSCGVQAPAGRPPPSSGPKTLPKLKDAWWSKSRPTEVTPKKRKSDVAAEKLKSLCGDGRLEEAMEVLRQMDLQKTVPTVECYGHLLRCCITRKALAEAKRVHAHIGVKGIQANSYLGNLLVNTFLKCGSLAHAVQVFNILPERTGFSWTAIITGYVKAGQEQEALRMYQVMAAEGVQPNEYTLVKLLKACATLGALDSGRKIHAAVMRTGCQSNLFVVTSLVAMYAKCGSMVDAQAVFDSLPQRDLASWNAMITGYAQQEQGAKALELFARMREEGVGPDNRTFVGVLKAYGSLTAQEKPVLMDGHLVKAGCLQQAKGIHAEAAKLGYEGDAFMSASLINLYANCGGMVEAAEVFEKLPNRDVVLWTAMIAGYAQQGQGHKALKLFAQMQKDGVQPNNRTFVSVLKACGSLAAVEQPVDLDGQMVRLCSLKIAKEVHTHVMRSGHGGNQFVCNTLIDIYSKCGSMSDAQHVFDELPMRDLVSWNVLVAGYSQQENGERALELFSRMQEEGLKPESRTFVSAFKACGSMEQPLVLDGKSVRISSLHRGRQVHAEAIRRGVQLDVFVATSVVAMYASCGSMVDAQNAFDSLPESDVVLWNAMLAGYVQQDEADRALELYAQMAEERVAPDSWTFVSVLKACGTLAASEPATLVNGQLLKPISLQKGKEIHTAVTKLGYESHAFVSNTLVDMYANCGDLVEARHVFDTIMEPNVVSWTAMIAGYAQQEEGEKGMQLYAQMQAAGVRPNETTFLCILKACSSTGSLKMCHQIHSDILESGVELSDKLTTTLVHAYSKCGSMMHAQRVFEASPHRDVFLWTALLAGYARQGDCKRSLQCFQDMIHSGIKPHGVTFLSVLAACSHGGMVEKGLWYFDSMMRDHNIAPTTEHYVSLVDLLGRAGLLDKAAEVISNMPMEPSLPLWLALLGACQKHSNVELGRQAFEYAVKLEPKLDAPYVLMSNIYADALMTDEANKVEDMRRRAGAWKKPGISWIEHSELVHSFLAGDTSHAAYDTILAKVMELTDDVKSEASDVQDTSLVTSQQSQELTADATLASADSANYPRLLVDCTL